MVGNPGAGRQVRFHDLWGFPNLWVPGHLTKAWSGIQELLPAPTGFVIEHVQIFFSEPNEI